MRTIIEITLGLLIIGILGIFLNPTKLLMPDSVNTALILGLIVVFLVFVGVVWRERAGDERDAMHMQKAGRLSFFVGISILVAAIILEALMHDIDPWLLLALSGMVLTKIISRIYHSFRN